MASRFLAAFLFVTLLSYPLMAADVKGRPSMSSNRPWPKGQRVGSPLARGPWSQPRYGQVLHVAQSHATGMPVASDAVSVESTVDENQVELGSSVQLSITIYNSQNSSPPQLPKIPDVQTSYLGPASRVSIINGQATSSVSYRYQLFPLKTGAFEIPSIPLTIDGKEYKTQPINVQVLAQGATPGAQAQPSEGQTQSLKDKIFLVMGTHKREFYVNEKIPVSIKLFVSGLSVKDIQYPGFGHDGFSADELQEPRQFQQTIGGMTYKVVEFKTLVYPAKTGDLTLGPTNLVCNILLPRKERPENNFDDFGGFFGRDFFSEFMGSYETHSLNLESADLAIHVLPLPEEGKPKDFSGAVGTFDFSAAVSPTKVKVGDPLTLRMRISGQGNMKAVTFPAVPDKQTDFKFYEPQIKDQDQGKVLEQVVIPTTDKVKQFPPLAFSCFDPGQKQYKIITQGPFPLEIVPLTKEEQLKVVGTAPASTDLTPESVGQDISFIKDYPGNFIPIGYQPGRIWFLMGSCLLIVSWFILLVWYGHSHRLRTDEKFARRFFAPRKARRGLEQARMSLEKEDEEALYDALFKTLQDYLGNKFHLPVGAVTPQSVQGILSQKPRSGDILEKVKRIFEECEKVRYASLRFDHQRMKDSYELTREIIDFFERNNSSMKKTVLFLIVFCFWAAAAGAGTAADATGFSPWRGDAPRAVLVRDVAVSHVPRTSGLAQLGPSTISRPEARTLFIKAGLAYRDGQFAQASGGYEEILKSGWQSGPVFYNLGNSYFRMGKLGKAVLNYERALGLMPRDSDLNANYRYALSLSKNPPIPVKLSERVFAFFTTKELLWILWLLGLVLASLHLVSLHRSWPLRRKIVILSIPAVLFLAALAVLMGKTRGEKDLAVIIADSACKFEPREDATTYFELSEGAKVKIEKKLEGWVKIQRRDQKSGWVKKENLQKI